MRRIAWTSSLLLLQTLLASMAVAQDSSSASRPMVPAAFRLQEAAAKAVAAEWLTDDERKDLRIRHGVWDERDLDTPTRRAAAALERWALDDPALRDGAVPVELRAEARLRAGDAEEALALLDAPPANPPANPPAAPSIRAARIRAESLEMLGRTADADAAVEPASQQLGRRVTNPDDLVEGVRALMVRARVRGQPAKDFQTMVTLLGRVHQDLDRLNWPARVVEAALLMEKDNVPEAVAAAHEALALNPRSSEAWFLLGTMALRSFDFDGVRSAAAALRRLDRDHPLARLLLAEMLLVQDDPDAARAELAAALARHPRLRAAVALEAAAAAVSFDEAGTTAALERYDALQPRGVEALYAAGRHLSFQRQYEWAAELLEEAVKRRPSWPAARIELALLELQSGRDARALEALESVAALDPFNKRCANSLFLLRELVGYKQLESKHFVIRYKPGVDEAVARLMPEALDAMHAVVAGRFNHEPERRTVIELMPDHQFFSVRITGMPWIHTIAACTGPVIAMEAPRGGPPHLHLGPYDWLQVLQHEYTHTVTLSQTRNRIPHWLTEAAAVTMETAPRKYETCQMLARELAAGTLFDLDEINWAFVRPRRAQDRGLAYAQGAWMVEFMNETMGSDALVKLIERYFDGVREERAMPEALGITREEFLERFLAWAQERVKTWGLAATPSVESLVDRVIAADPELREKLAEARKQRLDAVVQRLSERIGEPQGRSTDEPRAWPPVARPEVEITDETLAAWLEEFPDHPDLLELRLRRSDLGAGSLDQPRLAAFRRYAELRPVDPYPHRVLAKHLLERGDPAQALPHLEWLDALEVHSSVYALEIARLKRADARFAEALAAATKAVRIDGYDAANREFAAAIAIEAGQLDDARLHLEALVLLEPDREVHKKRLAALEALSDRQHSR